MLKWEKTEIQKILEKLQIKWSGGEVKVSGQGRARENLTLTAATSAAGLVDISFSAATPHSGLSFDTDWAATVPHWRVLHTRSHSASAHSPPGIRTAGLSAHWLLGRQGYGRSPTHPYLLLTPLSLPWGIFLGLSFPGPSLLHVSK